MKKWPILLIMISIELLSCNEKLGDSCNCELSEGTVILDYKKEYYWIEVVYQDSEDTYGEEYFGPYGQESDAYRAIERCIELERKCDE